VNTDQTSHECRVRLLTSRLVSIRTGVTDPRDGISYTFRATLGDHEVLLRRALIEEAAKTRTTIMERMDRLWDAVTGIHDDISVNLGAVDTARQVNENTREDVKQMREQVSVMYRRMLKTEAEIRELKGAP
jgi:hypothetical protein